uniref:Uncharacterized protein n=1 Tax=Compsopogon caeruleus TaxID=31354 RepID=A0A7S1TK72_9RHOD|mmetsp:Transcript_8500/g.17238  ORF Transcript_8500/g.17238 Transcript_8500/m.17238 type:complete len:121 (+) Transcript_8500:662-1024(+)|eukprot:CAMPEP_0184690814 /NCGR_PEP_ID=MMETSP0312-20130426/31448_1 /TAXON_ID=31354 /ORGANISM="Compsopogon coeruleus, Strain SAG 36.94" /LENGTH=120 /DNA_ID=CAMNT_0027148371 /DNA_START=702 /DNA_END=1064 /DNA_ORIENTATION=+
MNVLLTAPLFGSKLLVHCAPEQHTVDEEAASPPTEQTPGNQEDLRRTSRPLEELFSVISEWLHGECHSIALNYGNPRHKGGVRVQGTFWAIKRIEREDHQKGGRCHSGLSNGQLLILVVG